jgi:polyhydroxybutyrate depolymerase
MINRERDTVRAMQIVKTGLTAVAIAAAMILSGLPAGTEPDKSMRGVLTVAGINRSYLLHVPPACSGSGPRPLLVVLHGADASGPMMMFYTRFNDIADRNNFIVVYPNSVGPYWNDGRVDMNSVSFKANIDDVKFIASLIDHIASRYRVDTGRVYVAGFSNGGMMALRLAIAVPEKLAAVSSVSGLLPKHLSYLTPARPIPVMIIQGTDDPIVPCGGGKLNGKHGEVLSAVDTTAYWSSRNGCSSRVGVQVLPDRDPDDGTLVFRVSYACKNSGMEVVLLTIQGGGHTWPGAPIAVPDGKSGKTCRDISASDIIWDFFSHHRRT